MRARPGGAPQFTACPVPSEYTGLADGSHILYVRAVDPSGNVDATPASWTWTVNGDRTPPTTEILSGPDAETTLLDASFSFRANPPEPGATFECSLDNEPFSDCTSPAEYEVELGNHTFRVRATDLNGNVETPVVYAWSVILDTVPPETFLHAKPPASTMDTTALFSFSSNEFEAEFECSLDNEAFTGCSTPEEYTELATGEHTFAVRAVDLEGNVDLTPETWTWTVSLPPDTTPPDTTILSGPADPTGAIVAAFTFAAEAGSTFECSLDGEAFVECESGEEYSDITPGDHFFEVRATDLALNVELEPARWEWTVIGPPETTIDTGPLATSPTNIAAFTFSSDQLGARFFCDLDGLGFSLCESGISFSGLIDGAHTFEVVAQNLLGLTDETPALYEWTVAVPPDTFILFGPDNLTEATTAQFTFNANEVDASFECSLDGETPVDCDSPMLYEEPLAVGPHTFSVRAIDAEGNVDPTPATYSWTIQPPPDTTPPNTTIGAGSPPATTTDTSATFTFSSTEPNSTFTCQLDGSAPRRAPRRPSTRASASATTSSACGRRTRPATSTRRPRSTRGRSSRSTRPRRRRRSAPAARPPRPGTRRPRSRSRPTRRAPPSSARSTPRRSRPARRRPRTPASRSATTPSACGRADAVGNVDASPASYAWTIEPPDTTAPETTIDTGPAAPTNSTSATFTFSAEADSTYECALDGAAFAACASPVTYTDLAEGEHTFAVRATDASGNTDATPASRTWTVDLTPPDTSIGSGPASLTNQTTATFTFSASVGCELRVLARQRGVRGVHLAGHVRRPRRRRAHASASAAPTRPATSSRPRRAARGRSSGRSRTRRSTRARPSRPTTRRRRSPSRPRSARAYECALDAAAFAACTSPAEYTGLAAGEHTFRVRATDAAGNTDSTPASRTWTVDLPPETTIELGPVDPTGSTSASFRFASSEPGSSFECRLDDSSFSSCGSPQDYTDLATGVHTFSVRAKDTFGNVDPTPASHTWEITAAPETTIDSVTPVMEGDQTESTSVTFVFSADQAGATFECARDGGAFTVCTSPVTYTGLAQGAHEFEVRAKGLAGNLDLTPAEYGWEIGDLTPPVVALHTNPDATTGSTTATFTFSVDDPAATLQCSLDGAPLSICASPKTYTGLTYEAHTFEVTAIKQHLLVETTPVVYEWTIEDQGAPETTITTGPGAESGASLVTFEFTGSDNATAAADLAFECSLDGEAFASCSSPHELTNLPLGQHELQVRAVDEVLNADPTPASRIWTVVAPETTIVSGPVASGPGTGATFTFSSTEPGATFECSLDSAAFASCESPVVLAGLTIGSHSFQVVATDAAGNADQSPATYNWTVTDATAPETTITGRPTNPSPSSTADFTFVGSDNHDAAGRAPLRVPLRQRRRLRPLHQPEELHGPRRRAALHVRRACGRPGGQRRPDAGHVDVDDRAAGLQLGADARRERRLVDRAEERLRTTTAPTRS